jgi:hypothetical protein
MGSPTRQPRWGPRCEARYARLAAGPTLAMRFCAPECRLARNRSANHVDRLAVVGGPVAGTSARHYEVVAMARREQRDQRSTKNGPARVYRVGAAFAKAPASLAAAQSAEAGS